MKIKDALDSIISRFEQGDIPASIAMATFPRKDCPMNKWSYINRVLCFLNGTDDARGYRQWELVGRHVKKGCKSFPILAPKFKKVKEENVESEDSVILSGFLAVPVFRVEDTEGDPLPYQSIALPKLPLSEVAKEFGLDIKAIPSDYEYLGYYCHDRKEIAVATEHE